MSRIASRLRQLQERRRKALVPYVVAGDPAPGVTVALMHALVEAGADIIELGVPFSDPMAEGPVIQRAHERALAHDVSLRDTLSMVAAFREHDDDTPIVLMGYTNPVEVMGYDAFADAARDAGVDGLLLVDMPPEEDSELHAALGRVGIDTIFLLAPTTTPARLETICREATGYLYYVSLKGVTGAGNLDVDTVRERLVAIRAVTDKPVCVGFGIKDATSAATVAAVADGVVVGSAIVQCLTEGSSDEAAVCERARAFLAPLRDAMDRVTETA